MRHVEESSHHQFSFFYHLLFFSLHISHSYKMVFFSGKNILLVHEVIVFQHFAVIAVLFNLR